MCKFWTSEWRWDGLKRGGRSVTVCKAFTCDNWKLAERHKNTYKYWVDKLVYLNQDIKRR